MAVMTNASCLIVSDPDFRGQDQCTPSLLHHEADPETASTAPLEDPFAFRASIPLRSCALTRTYIAHVFADGILERIVDVPPTGSETRTVTVLFDVGALEAGCHQVEVYVSSRFSAGNLKVPERPDDVGYVAWWFANSPDATFESCRRSR